MLEFNGRGLLDAGDYPMTLEEMKESILVIHPDKNKREWDQEWRLYLVSQLSILVSQLWSVGLNEIYINGSFVEEKAHPNDIDGYFHCDVAYLATGELEQDLNKINPYKIWTWHPESRRPYRGYTKKQLPMWHKYRVELYPHIGQPAGITDQFGQPLQFPSAFRMTRYSSEQKGIIKVIK